MFHVLWEFDGSQQFFVSLVELNFHVHHFGEAKQIFNGRALLLVVSHEFGNEA